MADGHQVTIGGILARVNRRVNKNGEPWASAQLEDLAGGIEVLFFPRCYQVVGVDVAEDAIVLVKARVNRRDDRVSLIVNDLAVPDLTRRRPGRSGRAVAGEHAHRAVHPAAGVPAQGGARPPPGSAPRCTWPWSTAPGPPCCGSTTRLKVTHSPSLMGDLKALLGPGCLG